MKVKVNFLGNFRSIADRADQAIELYEDSTIKELLDNLIGQYSKMETILSADKII